MRAVPFVALVCGLAILAPAQRKKEKEEQTQTLQIPKDLPAWTAGETRRLKFYVTPLSAKGLLSQQIRDGLKALFRAAGGDTVLKIRAFVAGSGDLRRVRDLVSETFTDRHQPLPVLSLVRAGALPLEGAQVVLEGIGMGKKEVNPSGLVYISAQPAVSDNPLDPVQPLAEKTLATLRQRLKASGSEAANVLRVSCFFSSLDNLAQIRLGVDAEYPRAARSYLQTQRAPAQAVAACEAVVRAQGEVPRLAFGPSQDGLSQFARIGAPRVVLTGTQSSYGYEEKDARLAFERLWKSLEPAGVTARDVAFVHYYPLAPAITRQIEKIRAGFFDLAHPPAGATVVWEGLPSMDAGFAVDIVAVKE